MLLEPIKHEFSLSGTMLGVFSGISFALFYATLGIPLARWADRGDRRFLIALWLAMRAGASRPDAIYRHQRTHTPPAESSPAPFNSIVMRGRP